MSQLGLRVACMTARAACDFAGLLYSKETESWPACFSGGLWACAPAWSSLASLFYSPEQLLSPYSGLPQIVVMELVNMLLFQEAWDYWTHLCSQIPTHRLSHPVLIEGDQLELCCTSAYSFGRWILFPAKCSLEAKEPKESMSGTPCLWHRDPWKLHKGSSSFPLFGVE